MFYIKNLYNWERILRTVVSIGVAVLPFFIQLPQPWLWTVVGLSLAVSGIVGWCPMCAMIGRKIKEEEESNIA